MVFDLNLTNLYLTNQGSNQVNSWLGLYAFFPHMKQYRPQTPLKNRGYDRSAPLCEFFCFTLAKVYFRSRREPDRKLERRSRMDSNCGWLTGLFAFSDAKNLLQSLWLPLIQLRPQLRERSCIHGWIPISSEKWRSCYKGLCDKYAEQRRELVFVWSVMLFWDTRC